MALGFVTRGMIDQQTIKGLPYLWEDSGLVSVVLATDPNAARQLTVDGETIGEDPYQAFNTYDVFASSEQFFLIQLRAGSDPAYLALPVEAHWSFLFQTGDDTLKVAWNCSQIRITSNDPSVCVSISEHVVLDATLPQRLALAITEAKPATLADLAEVIKGVRQPAKS